jgi:ribonuclease E
MVEGNENSSTEPDSGGNAPKRRGGIFGVRRGGRGRGAKGHDEPTGSVPSVGPETVPTEPASRTETEPPTATDAATATPGDETAAAADARSEAPEPEHGRDEARAEASVVEAAEPVSPIPASLTTTSLIFHAPPVLLQPEAPERGERGGTPSEESSSVRRRTRRRSGEEGGATADDEPANTVVKVRKPREPELITEPQRVKGSTRLEAKKQRRRDGRDAGRRRAVITEAEFLARRESVDRSMVVREKGGRIQIGVLEDGVLVEHYVARNQDASLIGNVYLGRVQNVLPSMEAAFVDIGRGRNAVLYSGEVDWDAAAENGEKNQPRRIELALKPGDRVLVQVTKDPIGHKGARLTSQVSLPGRYLVYVPNGSMNGISRKLPDTERARLKKILRDVVPESAGVIVRTAAEGASEEELRADVERLTSTWEEIQAQAEASSTPRAGKSKGRKKNGGTGSVTTGAAPMLLHGEPDLTVRVIRDVFNEDFKQLVVQGDQAWDEIHPYITSVAPDLADRLTKWTSEEDLFTHHRVDEQLAKAMDRKVWLPSGGSLVIDRTEAMTVVDVNTGKFVGSGGNLEETVTKNNIEAAEEIVRQLRLRDIGGIIVIDFIDMVLESNRDLVVRRLLECLGRDRTKHQVAEVTSLGLVQMTRKRVGSGLIEVFSETCQHCNGRGFIIHTDPVDRGVNEPEAQSEPSTAGRRRGGRGAASSPQGSSGDGHNGNNGHNGGSSAPSGNGRGSGGSGRSDGFAAVEPPKHTGPTAAQIAAAAHAAALKTAAAADDGHPHAFPDDTGPWAGDDAPVAPTHDAVPAVELESDVPDATEPAVTAEVVSEAPGEVAFEVAVEAPPAPRGRRRRGRVVAPAGPPRGSGHGADGGDA